MKVSAYMITKRTGDNSKYVPLMGPGLVVMSARIGIWTPA